jgi:hypothetical protein
MAAFQTMRLLSGVTAAAVGIKPDRTAQDHVEGPRSRVSAKKGLEGVSVASSTAAPFLRPAMTVPVSFLETNFAVPSNS